MQKISLHVRDLLSDRSGLAAVEFAMIFPIMVVLYFGVVEFSSAIAVDRKATQVARTLSVSSITEVYIDKVSGVARVQWSKGLTIGPTGDVSIAAAAPHNPGDVVTLPLALVAAKGTFVIWSEVSYQYTPAIGIVLTSLPPFRDVAYTRPRLVLCVTYPTAGLSDCAAPK